jgi:hypothetical protein
VDPTPAAVLTCPPPRMPTASDAGADSPLPAGNNPADAQNGDPAAGGLPRCDRWRNTGWLRVSRVCVPPVSRGMRYDGSGRHASRAVMGLGGMSHRSATEPAANRHRNQAPDETPRRKALTSSLRKTCRPGSCLEGLKSRSQSALYSPLGRAPEDDNPLATHASAKRHRSIGYPGHGTSERRQGREPSARNAWATESLLTRTI